ncbi:MAG TPA: tetratricopeptide repeat protein [Terracidiphilus sp.]|jgi:tetratricopeptide (TPR) repeat protein|nr:tetratricopeptide repeat protein [Terracidiphilus sp.]
MAQRKPGLRVLGSLPAPRFRIALSAPSITLFSMKRENGKLHCAPLQSLVALLLLAMPLQAQSPGDEPAPQGMIIASLQLAPEQAIQLQKAVDSRDFIAAEKLLLAEIDRDPRSARAARLLSYAGTVYFLNQDYMNAAVAWKKSEAIAPLDPKLRFSLAMAYIRMAHPDWARPVLESLAEQNGKEALYPYWLGRVDYDGHEYKRAIRNFQHAIALDPRMARAYDNLGLCYYYQNQNDLAVSNYEKAIELDRGSEHPSAWPYLNLAITQQFLNKPGDAEKNLREAIRLDPGFAKAHFQLGTVLEDLQKPEVALEELKEAARLDPAYAEPHMALARVYHKLGHEASAREEAKTYLRLHPHSTP